MPSRSTVPSPLSSLGSASEKTSYGWMMMRIVVTRGYYYQGSLQRARLLYWHPKARHGMVSDSTNKQPSRQRIKQKANKGSRKSQRKIPSQRTVKLPSCFSIFCLGLTFESFEILTLSCPQTNSVPHLPQDMLIFQMWPPLFVSWRLPMHITFRIIPTGKCACFSLVNPVCP